MSKFVSTMRKGFHITFENGYTASVQWGAGNYCGNYFGDRTFSTDAESENAEVAVFKGDKMINANRFLPNELQDASDDVVGWLKADDVVEFLMRVKNT